VESFGAGASGAGRWCGGGTEVSAGCVLKTLAKIPASCWSAAAVARCIYQRNEAKDAGELRRGLVRQ
jgi:hypothetical protein